VVRDFWIEEKEDGDRSGQKIRRAFLLSLLVLVVVPLAGCQSGKEFPFYLMETHKDYPFLPYEIECCCSPEQGAACYRTSALGE